jgi:L-lactate dehydrogenase complex protein LldE
VTTVRVAVFVTCLAEAFAPEVAEAAAHLVAEALPEAAVDLVGYACCGQPAWNAGYPAEARTLAARLLRRLRPYALVVVPSGSCATMLLRYYPHLFAPGTAEGEAARAVAARTWELSRFLAARLPEADAEPSEEAAPPGNPVAFHTSCHALRGAGVGDAGPRCLRAAGCAVVRHAGAEECCGFGGLFAVKEPELSTALADAKLDHLAASGARTVVSGELGCLLHLEGRARRRGLPLAFRHLAEVLWEQRRHG